MGATCCRYQQVAFEDEMLPFPPSSGASDALQGSSQRHPHGHPHGYPHHHSRRRSVHRLHSSHISSAWPLRWSSAPDPPTTERRENPRRRPFLQHSLASYVAFPFPFASRFRVTRVGTASAAVKTTPIARDATREDGGASPDAAVAMAPTRVLGVPWVKTEHHTLTPRSLVALCIRQICVPLPVQPTRSFPSEVASMMLEWRRGHEALEKEHFQFLARFLCQEWKLQGLFHVDDSWFDNLALAPQQYLTNIDLSQCPNVTALGIGRWSQVEELPNLTTAAFEGCTQLSTRVLHVLQRSPRLSSLNLAGCKRVDDQSLVALRRLFRLKHLDLSGCSQITDEGLQCLTGLANLEKLLLSRCSKLTDASFVDMHVTFPRLKHLDIAHCRITDATLAHVASLNALITLVIRWCPNVSNEGVGALSTLTQLEYFDGRHCDEICLIPTEWSRLRVLLLTRTAFTDADAMILKNFPRLEEFDVKACGIVKRGFESIGVLSRLQRLTLAETLLADPGLIHICKTLPELVMLDVSHTEITDFGTSGLRNLKNLEVLHLDASGITNRSLAHVSTLKKLRRLDLFGASITDIGLLHLTRLRNLKELEICSGTITDRGVELISRIKSLVLLNLSQNRNINVKALYFIQTLTELQHLNLSNTAISAVSLRHLQPLKELRTLSIYGCTLDSADVEMLQDGHPKLHCLRCA